jgi:diguanylate cyclase (GGDEF)-like protein
VRNRKNRIVGVLTILLFTGFVTTSFVSYFVAHKSITDQIVETTLPLTSDNIYSEIQRDLLSPIFISSLMANDTFVRDWALGGEQDEKAIIRYLTEIQKKYGTISSFFVSEKTGKYYHPKGILKKISETDPQDKWYYSLRKIDEDYEVNVDIDTADRNSMTIFINHRVYDYSGKFIGATGVGLAVKEVNKLINIYQTRYGRRVYFTDREGAITLSSGDFKGVRSIRKIEGLSILATQILANPSSSINYKNNGKTVYLNSRIVPQFNWYLLVEQVEDPAEKRILKTFLMNLAISLIITLVVLFLANLTIGKYQRKIEEMATTDNLTGLSNRQIFDSLYDQALKFSNRQRGGFSSIMFDIDHFKKVNDTYGHPAGDIVIKAVAQSAKSEIRNSDVICRWGGEEFIVLLPNCDIEKAGKVAEKMRQTIEDQKKLAYNGEPIYITASFGVAQYQEGDTRIDLVRRVDRALYAAKKNGRNRVESAG